MRIISLFFLVMIISCSKDSEKTLIDDYDIDTTSYYYPSISNQGGIKAWMTGPETITGFGNEKSFTTNTNFETLLINGDGHVDGNIVYNNYSSLLLANNQDYWDFSPDTPFVIKRSDDFGLSYYEYLNIKPSVDTVINNQFIRGYHKFDSQYFTSSNKGWLISNYNCLNCAFVEDEIQVFSVNGMQVDKIASIDYNYNKVNDVYFANTNLGWMLTNDQFEDNKSFLWITEDGGNTWPFLLDLPVPFQVNKLLGVSENLIIAYHTIYGTSRMVKSTDKGHNWQEINCSCYSMTDIEFVNDQVGYIVCNNGSFGPKASTGDLMKTIDGGETWVKVNSEKLYVEYVSFYDENIGIAVSKNVIQLTQDGGENWELIHMTPSSF